MLRLWPFLILFFYPISVMAKEWNFKNDPFFNISKSLETKLEKLPESSELSATIETNWIWPLGEGGIRNRWGLKNTRKEQDRFLFNYFALKDLKNVDLTQLSPIEKYDLYLENSDWAFSRFIEKSQKASEEFDFKSQLAFSESILKFKNPSPLILETKSGFSVPFGSSDIKALLFASILFHENLNPKILGNPCKISFSEFLEKKSPLNFNECDGINPGSFHIVLANFLGLRDEGIVLDLKRDKIKKLRPIVGFVSNFKEIEGSFSPDRAKNSKREVLVTTYIKYIRPESPMWISDPSPSSRDYESYVYTLELDIENNIVGGAWISFNRPDYLVINDFNPFNGKFKNLEPIYKTSTNSIKEEDLKLNGLEQKFLILETISKNRPERLVNGMFDEYFDNYKTLLIEKKETKKNSRKKLSRELKITKYNLLKKIKGIPVPEPLKGFALNFLEGAEKNPPEFDLYKIQQSFLNHARKNFRTSDLVSVGRLAYLQQKFIDDYSNFQKKPYHRFNFVVYSFIAENTLFNTREILTANPLFLEKIKDFLRGARLEQERLKANPTGDLKKNSPKIKPSPSTSPIALSFLEEIKKGLSIKKAKSNTYWKRFLLENKSIKSDDIHTPSTQTEIKKYVSNTYNSDWKRAYRLSFILKRIQALRKVQETPIFNTRKDKIDYYQQKFFTDINLKRTRNNFQPLSKLEALTLYKGPSFKDPSLKVEALNAHESTKKEVAQFNNQGSKFITAIKKGDKKTVDELLKDERLLNFENNEKLNPMLTAISEGQKEIILKILSSKTNIYINYEDKLGRNALTLSIIKKLDENTLKLLIEKGVDLNARDNLGKYPRDYLNRNNSFDLYLKNLGAKTSMGIN